MSEQSAENGLRRCPDCGHVPRAGFGCAGRPTPSDIWAGVYPGDCDCPCAPSPVVIDITGGALSPDERATHAKYQSDDPAADYYDPTPIPPA